MGRQLLQGTRMENTELVLCVRGVGRLGWGWQWKRRQAGKEHSGVGLDVDTKGKKRG